MRPIVLSLVFILLFSSVNATGLASRNRLEIDAMKETRAPTKDNENNELVKIEGTKPTPSSLLLNKLNKKQYNLHQMPNQTPAKNVMLMIKANIDLSESN